MKLVSWGSSISKAGYISREVTMHTKEVQTLYFFKQKLGRAPRFKKKNLYSVHRIGDHSSSFRWKLHNRSAIERLVDSVNGRRIRTISKQKQMRRRVCRAMIIEFIEPNPLTVENAWVSGFGDGLTLTE